MKPFSVLLSTFALAAGGIGATAAYQLATPDVSAPVSATVPTSPATPADPVIVPGRTFGWAPCPAGTRQRGEDCVRRVVRLVSVPAAGSAQQAQNPDPVQSGGQAPSPQRSEDDHEAEHELEGEDELEDEDEHEQGDQDEHEERGDD